MKKIIAFLILAGFLASSCLVWACPGAQCTGTNCQCQGSSCSQETPAPKNKKVKSSKKPEVSPTTPTSSS